MKKILILGAVMFAAIASQASYLYWQITTDVASSYADKGVDFARVYAVNDSTGAKTQVGASQFDKPLDTEYGYAMDMVISDIGTTFETGYSFIVELVNYETSEVHAVTSDTWNYSRLLSNGFIQTTLMDIPVAWAGGSIAVPEPTSGLLILLGLASLALKRKSVS